MKYEDLKKELAHKERSINDLVSYLKTRTSPSNPNYSLLLGAGASVTSGIRSGKSLVDTWRKEIYELYSGKTYENVNTAKTYLMTSEGSWYSEQNEYSSLFEKKFDLPTQRRRFVEQEVDRATPSIGYAYLVSLANEMDRYFGTIYTTNFDDLINEAFYQFSLNRPLVCAHDSSVSSLSVSSTRPKIIKLHGDYLFDDIKSTLRETESLESNIKNKFIEFSKEYGLIVVGYAGHDRSIMDVLNHLLKSDDYFKNGLYWCVREDDDISPELRKLLWKERVYFVKIDGYDQLMAELHHNLIGELPIKDNLFESKHERILKSFANDSNNLSDTSSYIYSDIVKLKKHKSEVDISNSIRELNITDFEDEISESIFKSLLKVDYLIRQGEFHEAYELAGKQIRELKEANENTLFIRKMIYICSKLSRVSEALNFCDLLIEKDVNNSDYYVLKADTYENIDETCHFLKDNLPKFSKDVDFLVDVARRGLRQFSSRKAPVFCIEEISDILEKSLKLEPSLENPAWSLKVTLIDNKYKFNTKDSKKKEDELKQLVGRASDINPNHIRYLSLLSESSLLKDKGSFDFALKRNLDIFEISKKSKRRKIFYTICQIYSEMADCQDKGFDLAEELHKFFDSDLVKEFSGKKDMASYHLLKSYYEINFNDDFEEFKKCVIQASKCSDSYKSASSIVNMFLRQFESAELAVEFINNNESNLSKVAFYDLMSEVNITIGNFDEALENLDLSYSFGLDYEDYISSKCFLLIKSRKYVKVVDFVDKHKDTIHGEEYKSILLVNKEYSNKMLDRDVKDIVLRNIIGKKFGKGTNAACYSILGDLVSAQRSVDDSIAKDRLNYGLLKTWVVLDESLLTKHDHTLSLVNVKPIDNVA